MEEILLQSMKGFPQAALIVLVSLVVYSKYILPGQFRKHSAGDDTSVRMRPVFTPLCEVPALLREHAKDETRIFREVADSTDAISKSLHESTLVLRQVHEDLREHVHEAREAMQNIRLMLDRERRV